MSVPLEIKNFTSIDEHIAFMETMLGYLEKASSSNLGDFTESGKIVNAGYNNYTVYWDWYKKLGYQNMQGSAYCACFVSVVLASSFGLDTAKKLLCGDLYVYCPTGYNQFKAKSRIYNKPQVGDIVFFWSDSMGRYSHTGYVVGTDSAGYTTIEANTSSGNDTVVANGGATCRKHYTTGNKKDAFGRPDYEGCGISLHSSSKDMVTYSVGTGDKGLEISVNLRVRKTPNTKQSNIVGMLKPGDIVHPTLRTFTNGDPWYYDEKVGGWFSGKYMTGWVQDHFFDDKWWWVDTGYKYPVNEFRNIDNKYYYFDSTGYMFRGTIKFTTNPDGSLKSDFIEE